MPIDLRDYNEQTEFAIFFTIIVLNALPEVPGEA